MVGSEIGGKVQQVTRAVAAARAGGGRGTVCVCVRVHVCVCVSVGWGVRYGDMNRLWVGSDRRGRCVELRRYVERGMERGGHTSETEEGEGGGIWGACGSRYETHEGWLTEGEKG